MPKSINEATLKAQFRRGFKADADRKAVQCRIDLDLKPYDPLPCLRLAKHLNLEVLTPSDIEGLSPSMLDALLHDTGSDAWSAITLGVEKPSLIIHNSSHSLARTESNIMHEIAHVLLEHPMCEIDTSFGIPLRKYDAQQEIEAEWLGACLQLPKEALLKYYVYEKMSADDISAKFNASVQMVNYRIGVSGVKIIKSRFKYRRS